MAVWFVCAVCQKELTQPGAVLFSPPRPMGAILGTVVKRHICVGCYELTLRGELREEIEELQARIRSGDAYDAEERKVKKLLCDSLRAVTDINARLIEALKKIKWTANNGFGLQRYTLAQQISAQVDAALKGDE